MKFFYNLRNMLTLNFIMLGVLPMVIIGLMTLNLLTDQMKKELTQRNALLARSVAGEVERLLQTHLNVLEQIKAIVSDQKMIGPEQIYTLN